MGATCSPVVPCQPDDLDTYPLSADRSVWSLRDFLDAEAPESTPRLRVPFCPSVVNHRLPRLGAMKLV